MPFEAVPINELTEATELDGLSFVAGNVGGVPFKVPVALLQALGFIPLDGTPEGSPVTGPIRHDPGVIGSTSLFSNGEIRIGSSNGSDLENDDFVGANYFRNNATSSLSEISAKTIIGNAYLRLIADDDTNVYHILVNSSDANSQGITSDQYFPNKDPNTYAQMADLVQLADNYADDAAAAAGGIAVGKPYHTGGIVKIRLS